MKLKTDEPVHFGSLSKNPTGYARNAGQTGVTTDTGVTVRWRPLHLRYDAYNIQVGHPSWMCIVTRTARLDNQTDWLLVSFSDHNRTVMPHNTAQMPRDSVVPVDVTPIPRRQTLQDPNRSRLAYKDLESC